MKQKINFWFTWSLILMALSLFPEVAKTGDVTFIQNVIDTNLGSAFTVDAADMDNDGDIDILAGGQSGKLNLYINNGNKTFTKKVIESNYGAVWSVEAFDVNQDGKMDIIAAVSKAENITWYKNNGGNNFSKRIIDNNMVSAEDIAAGDLDGDGDIDLVGFGWNDTTPTRWYENDGRENFTIHELDYSFKWAHFVALADFDKDGDLDIVGTNGGGISWWRNNGSASFTKKIVSSSFSGAYCAQPADLDQDGKMDIIGAAHNIDTIAWFRNSGSGSFTKNVLTNTFDDTHDAYVGDIDRDGDLDFVGTSRALNGVAWFENRGNQTFIEHMISTSVTEAQTVCLADLDGDGDLDVISEGRKNDKVYWWENRSTPTEVVSTPDKPTGPTTGFDTETLTFRTGGATSNLGHSVEYQFDWGDGTTSSWGSATASHSFAAGSYAIKARARCVTHTSKVSGWSTALNLTVEQETVSAPNKPTGDTQGVAGESLSYQVTGAVSNAGHAVEYQYDWGDGNTSSWGDGSRTHQFAAAGTYSIRARARCQSHTSVVSGWSSSLSVTINPATHQISGTVTYYSTADAVPGVTINVTGDVNEQHIADNSGNFSFRINENSSITMRPTKQAGEDISHLTVTMYDAALTAQAALNLISLDQNQELAADADQNGSIYTYDAALIAQHAVGISQPSYSHVGEWYFTPETRTINNIQSNKTGQNFTGIVIGDVDGGWTPASGLLKVATDESFKDYEIENIYSGDERIIKIKFNSARNMISFDLDIGFDENVLTYLNTELADGIKDFQFYQHIENGRVRIGMYSVESSMIDGDVIDVHFNCKNKDRGQFVEIKRMQLDDKILVMNKVLNENDGKVIQNFELKQNFPNPFNSSTLINYTLKEGGLVKLIVYNVSGQQIKVLFSGTQEKGNYTISWDGIDDAGKKVAGGVYFYQLTIKNFKETKKMVIVE